MNMTDNALKPLDYTRTESPFSVLLNRAKIWLFRKVTKNSSNLFMRGQDIISIYPQVVGVHEPVVTDLINHFSNSGYNDFLIDIGANIGLTSCQNGNHFKRVDMFEPNPYCCKLIEVNSAIALNGIPHHLHKYGLGAENKTTTLNVPKDNWGGAFVRDDSNSYGDSLLASKDGFQQLSDANYFSVGIEIRKTTDVLGQLFSELAAQNLAHGVIKIDVEGYEPVVLKGIADSIPMGISAMIVFESWDKNFDMTGVTGYFKGRATPYKLAGEDPWDVSLPKPLRVISLLFHGTISNRIVANTSDDWYGQLILHVN